MGFTYAVHFRWNWIPHWGLSAKKGKANTESNGDGSTKRCSAGSSVKKNLEENEPEAIGESDAAGMDWEEGHVSVVDCKEGYSHDLGETVTVEFTDVPSSTEKKSVRRHTAEEKASVLSVLPHHLLLNGVDIQKLDANNLRSLVSWFHCTFSVIARSTDRGSFESNMAFALQSHVGTAEEVCAISVALFRALNLTTRFVTNMDVVGLKPDAKATGTPNRDVPRLSTRELPCSSVVAGHNEFSTISPAQSEVNTKESFSMTKQRCNLGNLKNKSACRRSLSKNLSNCKDDQSALTSKDESSSRQCPLTSSSADIPKRKGDAEFELQLQMALSATAAEIQENKLAATSSQSTGTLLNSTPPLKKLRKNAEVASNSSAVWSRNGAPLYWAEVYYGGQTVTGRWVHVDVVNDITDGERQVEAASAVCRKPLRYVVAFAGSGAKDVTRRYCLQWHRIVQGRVNPEWWDNVMAPLEQLELAATNDSEEMELQTKALTEPLPTNQQAYKDHHLYALEKWLHKNQVLHPKGPVLGFCKGHPVYPRSCVQTLQSRHGWLPEGLQVRENESPAKVVTRPKRTFNSQSNESNSNDDGVQPTMELYGKWQLEPLQLPRAVNGIVPKVAKRLGIDYAPAMVGFDYRNGQCVPLFDGIVVRDEFKNAILEAYDEEEERRQAAERKQEEAQALSSGISCSVLLQRENG
ncbi:hypothetical protein ACQ4PT_028684 [Festuca glaucescens]